MNAEYLKNKDIPIIYIDGHCFLCNRWIQFIMKHDVQQKIYFAHLPPLVSTQSVELHWKNKVYTKSDVVIHVAHILGGKWEWISRLLTIIPAFIRNSGYDLIAKNRYRFWGRSEQCILPTPELMERFVA